MKTFKRITATTLAVLMVLATILTVNVFADSVTFPDVANDYYYKDAIYSLVNEGVINGVKQEDGTFLFKPEDTITRAEFAKLVAVATAGNVALTETTTRFPDLAVDHWANTYIAYAVKMGIINGNSDGTFRPENPVSYGEAVKMLVCAKGYGSLYTATEPWYNGYIKIANDIDLTKKAQALGSAEAKRGMVAQLIYNMDYTKKIEVSTGGNKFGDSVDNDEYEEDEGVVVGVFETTLTSENLGLNKFEIMIDDEVYNIGSKTLDAFYPYLGKSISFEYSEGTGSKKIIERFTDSGKNDTITITANNIDSVSSSMIEYYESDTSNKLSEAKLDSNIYVIYNGRGVPQSKIDDDFIEKYFDVETGEITLMTNDNSKDYEVAYITSYETYYVAGRSVNEDVYTFNDTTAAKSVALDTGDCTVEKATKIGSTSSSTLSGIGSSKFVLSVAQPFDTTEGTKVIASSITLSKKTVDEMSGYDYVVIDGEEYKFSDYFMALKDKDSATYSLEVNDTATFYLDFQGNIVYFTRTESTDPYAYVLGFDSGNGLNGTPEINLFEVSGSSGSKVQAYPLKDTVKVDGSSKSAAEVKSILSANAAEMDGNSEYGQLVKFKTTTVNGVTCLSELFTIDGSIGVEFTDGTEVVCESGSSNRQFADANGDKFLVNSSTVVIQVGDDREDGENFKRRSYSWFVSGNKYVVEPYDVTSRIAKAVLVYGGSTDVTVKYDTKVAFVEKISDKKNSDGDKVKSLTYYYAGDESTSEILTAKYDTLDGINPGDLVKLAIDDNEVVKVQWVYVDGVLYDYVDGKPFDTTESEDNIIEHGYSSDPDWYKVVIGTVDTLNLDDTTMSVVPVIVNKDEDYDGSNPEFFTVKTSTKVYELNTTVSPAKYETKDPTTLTAVDKVTSASTATKVLVVENANTVKAIYIIK